MQAHVEQIRAESAVVIDAENLFYSRNRPPHKALEAVCDWVGRQMASPVAIRTYGNLYAIARNAKGRSLYRRTTKRLGVIHTSNKTEKDLADYNLIGDVQRVRDHDLHLVVGSGDNKVITSCLGISANYSPRVDWIILNFSRISRITSAKHDGRGRKAPADPFAADGVFAGFPRKRVTTIFRIYQSWHDRKTRGATNRTQIDITRTEPVIPDPPIDAFAINWMDLKLKQGATVDDAWAHAATSRLIAASVMMSPEDCENTVNALRTWLFASIPQDHQDQIHLMDDDAWTFHCLASVFAAALSPGNPMNSIEARLFRGALANNKETTERALCRASQLVQDRFTYDQRGAYQLLERTHRRG